MLGDLFFRIISFLSSFIGTTLLIVALYLTDNLTDKLFFLGELTIYSFILGLVLVMLVVFFSRTPFRKLMMLKSQIRRQGMKRRHASKLTKAMRHKYLSGHIARAFLLGTVLFFHNKAFIFPVTIFCALVILAMMKLRAVGLLKILLSALLGTLSGLIAVNISNFF